MATIPDVMALGQSPIPRRARGIVSDTSGEESATALGRFAGTIGDIADKIDKKDQELARAKDANNYLDHQISVKQLEQTYKDKVASGEIPYGEAQQKFMEDAQKIPAPQPLARGSVSAENLNRGITRNIQGAEFGISQAVSDARDKDLQSQGVLQLDSLGKLAGMPDANIESINKQADLIGPLLRTAGLNQVQVTRTIQDFKDKNWLNQATQKAMQARDSLPALKQMEHELTDADGFYAGKLDTDKRNAVLNAVIGHRIALENKQRAHLSDLRETLREQINDVHAALLDGRPISQEDLPDASQLELAFGEKGRHYARQMNATAALSNEVQSLHNKTNDELKAELVSNSATKAQGGVAGAADESALRTYKKQIITNIVQQRERDPATYITSTSPVAAQALKDLSNDVSGSGERYFRAVDTERTRLGIQSKEIMPTDVVPGGNEWQKVALLAARNYTMLPKEAAQWADTGLRSNDPEVASKAARFVANTENVSHDAASKVGSQERTTATQLNRLLDSGSSIDSAMAAIKESRNIKPEIRAERVKQYTKTYQPQNMSQLNSLVDEFDPGVFSSQPTVPAEMQADFDNKVQTYFVDRGDINLARKRAWDDMKRVYSPSHVNGSFQMLLLPPERFGMRPEEVRKDIATLVAAHPQPDGSTAEDIVIVPSSKTIRQAEAIMNGEQITPSYRLITKSGDEFTVDGRRKEYTLPPLNELAAKRKTEAADLARQQIEQARFDRQTQREFDRGGSGPGILR